MLYSNPYSNAGEHQRKYTTHYGQKRAISSTKRTWANACEQPVSSPPFGMPSISFEPHHTSSKATSSLRCFILHLCTATRTATVATAFQPLSQRSKVDAEIQNRNRANAPKGSMLLVAGERNKRELLFSRIPMQRSTKADTSKQRKSSSPFFVPNISSSPTRT